MTVVAGFQHEGVPILLGDFLLSRDGIASGVRRKLFRFSNNFVAGWTGTRLTAQTIMSELFERFGGTNPTFNDIRGFLAGGPEPISAGMAVSIVGWVVDTAPRCFCWHSDYPSDVYENESYFFGSGGPTLERMVRKPRYVGMRGLREHRSAVDYAIYFSLDLAGRLLADELCERQNQEDCFGVAYEILVYDGTSFEYVDDILYTFCDFSSSDVMKVFNPNYYKFRQLGELSAVQRTNVQTDHTVVDLITPVFDSSAVSETTSQFANWMQTEKKTKPFPVTSKYYCLVYRLTESEGSVFPGAIVCRSAGGNQPITINRTGPNTEEMGIKIGVLYDFIQRFRKGNI